MDKMEKKMALKTGSIFVGSVIGLIAVVKHPVIFGLLALCAGVWFYAEYQIK